jgi:integrase
LFAVSVVPELHPMATISRRGDRWRAQVRKRGHKPQSETFETKARAQAWATQQEAEILAGKRGEYPKKTFADALDRYLTEESVKKAGLRWEKIRIEAFKRSTMASKPINSLTEADIAEWRNERLKAVSGATVRREMGLLGSVFDVARREWKWCAANPMRDVSKPRGSAARRRGIAIATIDAISPNLSGECGKQVFRAFLLAIETAMRKGEILGLRWDQVAGAVAYLPKTKNGDARSVALSQAALAILEEQKGLNPVKVFTVDPASADALFRKAVKKAGIPDLHFHDSRSEAITRLSKKLDVLELARQVGHRDLKSLLIYYAPSVADMAKKLG